MAISYLPQYHFFMRFSQMSIIYLVLALSYGFVDSFIEQCFEVSSTISLRPFANHSYHIVGDRTSFDLLGNQRLHYPYSLLQAW